MDFQNKTKMKTKHFSITNLYKKALCKQIRDMNKIREGFFMLRDIIVEGDNPKISMEKEIREKKHILRMVDLMLDLMEFNRATLTVRNQCFTDADGLSVMHLSNAIEATSHCRTFIEDERNKEDMKRIRKLMFSDGIYHHMVDDNTSESGESHSSPGSVSDSEPVATSPMVDVSDNCKNTYDELKMDEKHRYIIFYIPSDEKQIDVEVVGNRGAEYDSFLEDIQKGGPGECRYGLFDFECMHQCEGTSKSSKKQTLFLMSWCPNTATVKKKMLYSSSFDALKKSLVGVQKYIQATNLCEVSLESVEEKLRATDRE